MNGGYGEGMLSRSLLIALDYDETFTEDPALWLQFVSAASSRGHQVICCTMRHEHEGDDMDQRLLKKVKVHFTGRQLKRPFLKAIGIEPDIWIDDEPAYIVEPLPVIR